MLTRIGNNMILLVPVLPLASLEPFGDVGLAIRMARMRLKTMQLGG